MLTGRPDVPRASFMQISAAIIENYIIPNISVSIEYIRCLHPCFETCAFALCLRAIQTPNRLTLQNASRVIYHLQPINDTLLRVIYVFSCLAI